MPALTQILGQAKVDDLVLAGCLALSAVCFGALVVMKWFDRSVNDAVRLPATEGTLP